MSSPRSQGSPARSYSSRSSGSKSRSPSPRSVSPASNASNASVRSHQSNHSNHSRSSRAASPGSRRSSPKSRHSNSRSRSRSASAASNNSNNRSSRSRSATPRSRSGSPRNDQGSPGSKKSRSRSGSRSRSASPGSNKGDRSRSGTPGSAKGDRSRSGSPVSAKGDRSRSGSPGSPKNQRSRSVSPGSPKDQRSRSGSPGSVKNRSRSGSPGSVKDQRSRSGSPGSPKDQRSRSGSPGSPKDQRSRSGSPGSPKDQRSRSGSPVSKPRGSKSPEAEAKSGYDSDEEVAKRKLADLEATESDVEAKKAKRHRALIDSDSEEETPAKTVKPTADALFGDASDISSDDEKKSAKSRSRSRSKSRSKSRSRSRSKSRSRSRSRSRSHSRGRSEERQEDPEDKEKEDEPEPPPETRIDVLIPKITTDLGKEIHFVKLPNFLSVETRPFDHETYEDEIDEEETLDEEGRARLKLKVENTIRWREEFGEDGKPVKESNARFVRWSDGSMSLHLGSEIFDVYKQPLQGDHNHLYIRQGTGLQGQAVFRTKLTFRPHSTDSFTHKKMTMSLADRSQKLQGIKVLSTVGHNPDQNRYELIKKEEEKLRMALKNQGKTKKTGSGRGAGRSASYAADAYNDDGSDDEGAISLAAIKSKHKKGGAVATKVSASNIYSSDEEGSDFETTRPRKSVKGKVLKESDEESNASSNSGSDSGGDNEKADADSD